MAFSYDDFLRQAQGSGLLKQFSSADLDTAKKYPEFGLSILSLKKDFGKAETDEERLLINQAANQIRGSYANYSGGADGSDFISGGKIPGQIDTILDQINSFVIPEDPTAAARQAKIDEILNRGEFSWNKDTDPLWPVYKKQYLREGERATANALGQAAAATGGRPSSFAVGAATQAGDYYATQLNDIIPVLYQQAYNKYLDEINLDRQDLQALNEQRSLWRQDWQDQLGLFDSKLSALQGQDAIDYGRFMDEINLGAQKDERDYQRGETLRQTAVEQVAAILQAGGTPSDELLAAAGLTTEYAQGVNAGWNRDNAVKQVADIVAAGGTPSDELLAAAGLTTEYAQGINAGRDRESAVKQVADILAAGGMPSDELLFRAGLTTEYAQGVHGKFQREEADERQGLARAQVDAILQAGGTPSAELIAASGYSGEYVTAMANAVKRGQMSKTEAKGTGNGGAKETSTPTPGNAVTDATEAIAAFNSGDHSDAVIEKLLAAGYTEQAIKTAGYTGNYFGNNDQPGGAAQAVRFEDYNSAVGYLRKQGVLGNRTPMTESEWSTRRSSYKRTGHGSVEVKNYETYADYISAYVQYCMENPAR